MAATVRAAAMAKLAQVKMTRFMEQLLWGSNTYTRFEGYTPGMAMGFAGQDTGPVPGQQTVNSTATPVQPGQAYQAGRQAASANVGLPQLPAHREVPNVGPAPGYQQRVPLGKDVGGVSGLRNIATAKKYGLPAAGAALGGALGAATAGPDDSGMLRGAVGAAAGGLAAHYGGKAIQNALRSARRG